MATNGVLPNRLADSTLPVCADCIYGNATKRPCNTKTAISINESKPVAPVGDCVSVSLLVSRTPALIAHMSGFITRQLYQYECVFVDHNSDFTHEHLIKSQTRDEQFESK